MKLDLLYFAAHPDDVELGCAGTILKLTAAGKKVGIVDLTRGELGSRGSAELREKEAQEAGKLMGLSARENLGFRDGFFQNDEAHQLKIIEKIRKYRPEVVIGNAPYDRHPDHGRGCEVVKEAFFKSGLRKIETFDEEGKAQEHYRPKRLFHYIQDHYLDPSFVVDITGYEKKKMEVIQAYGSQFFNPKHDEPATYISSADFWHFLEARARDMGHRIGVTFGEGYISATPVAVNSPLDLV